MSSEFKCQIRPIDNGHAFRTKLSVTTRCTTAMRTTTSNAISFSNGIPNCNGAIIVARHFNFGAHCTRLARVCEHGNTIIAGNSIVNFINDANLDANGRLRCRIVGGSEVVGPVGFVCKASR